VVVVHLDRLEDALPGGVGVEEVVDLFFFFSSWKKGEFFFPTPKEKHEAISSLRCRSARREHEATSSLRCRSARKKTRGNFFAPLSLRPKEKHEATFVLGGKLKKKKTHLDVLVLVLLVVLEEPPDLVQPVLGQLRDVLEVAVLGVVSVDGDDLVVALALVDHLHHADGLRAQEGHGHDGFLHQDEDVERVVVLAERLGDEA
jgi:hypothetical protein